MDVGLVCDACSALTPIGVPQCARCGAAVALDPRPRGAASRPPPMNADNGSSPNRTVPGVSQGRDCPKCGTFVNAGTKFCGSCGQRMPPDVDAFDVETRVGPLGARAVQGTPSGLAAQSGPGKS